MKSLRVFLWTLMFGAFSLENFPIALAHLLPESAIPMGRGIQERRTGRSLKLYCLEQNSRGECTRLQFGELETRNESTPFGDPDYSSPFQIRAVGPEVDLERIRTIAELRNPGSWKDPAWYPGFQVTEKAFGSMKSVMGYSTTTWGLGLMGLMITETVAISALTVYLFFAPLGVPTAIDLALIATSPVRKGVAWAFNEVRDSVSVNPVEALSAIRSFSMAESEKDGGGAEPLKVRKRLYRRIRNHIAQSPKEAPEQTSTNLIEGPLLDAIRK
jgi:hypothetical protein